MLFPVQQFLHGRSWLVKATDTHVHPTRNCGPFFSISPSLKDFLTKPNPDSPYQSRPIVTAVDREIVMLLILRTLLAYQDDRLSAANARELGQKFRRTSHYLDGPDTPWRQLFYRFHRRIRERSATICLAISLNAHAENPGKSFIDCLKTASKILQSESIAVGTVAKPN